MLSPCTVEFVVFHIVFDLAIVIPLSVPAFTFPGTKIFQEPFSCAKYSITFIESVVPSADASTGITGSGDVMSNSMGFFSYIGSTPLVTFSICDVIVSPFCTLSTATPLNVLLASIAIDCDAPM